MQAVFKDGSVMVAGSCGRDAQLRVVGEKGSRVCSVGLAVGKKPCEQGARAETIWCNLKAWHNLASVLAKAQKGDAILAIGKLEKREHDGKTYTDLLAEYVSIAGGEDALAPADLYGSETEFEALGDDDQLPF